MILLMLSLISYGISMILLYMLFDMLHVPVKEDGHRYMPFSNILQAGISAVPVAVAIIISLKKYFK